MQQLTIPTNNHSEMDYFQLNNLLNIPKDGKIQLDKDREAVRSYFLNEVNPKTMFFHTLEEKLDYLVENRYIQKELFEPYSQAFLKKIFQYAYDKKFRFKTFMGAYKFYTQYALKTKDNQWILERYEDRAVFNALAFAEGDENLAMDLIEELMSQRYQPATPSYLNTGRVGGGGKTSCFLLDISDDMNGIGRAINSSLQLSKRGGGVALSLNNIRGTGDKIQGIEGLSDGVVPILKLLENSFSYANQLGQRNGSGVAYLSVFNPEIIRFLSVRKENADEKIRIKTLSLGLVVPDKFYELIRDNKDMYLFSPKDVEDEYGIPFGYVDITKEYENMVANPKIKKEKINARQLEEEISNLQNESGYPYIINIDVANRMNPIFGRVIMSNLCTEIFQVHKPSVIKDDQTYEVLGHDVSCNLGSTNVVNLMESPHFGKSVITAFKALDYVAKTMEMDCVPTIQRGNELYTAVGLGAMNLHGMFAKNQMEYGSDESLEFTDMYFMLLNYWTLQASNQIAMEQNRRFHEFELSDYANGTYFDKYLPTITNYDTDGSYQFNHKKVENLFSKHFIPTLADWEELNQSIQKHGLANSYRMAVAP